MFWGFWDFFTMSCQAAILQYKILLCVLFMISKFAVCIFTIFSTTYLGVFALFVITNH